MRQTYRVSKPTSFPACDQGSRRKSLQLGTLAAVESGAPTTMRAGPFAATLLSFSKRDASVLPRFQACSPPVQRQLLPQRRIKGDELQGQFSALTVINPVFQMANDKQRVIAFFASLLNISGALRFSCPSQVAREGVEETNQ